MLFFTSGVLADKTKTEQELQQLQKAIAAVKDKLSENQQQQSKAEKRLSDADKKLSAASKNLRNTRNSITNKQSDLKSLKKEQTIKQVEAQQQKILLANQLRSAYKSGNEEYLKLLLNQEDPAKVTRMLKYYDYLNKARIENIQALQNNLKRLNEIELAINSNILDLQSLQQSQEEQRSNLLTLKKEQQSALEQLKTDYSSDNQRLSKLRRNEQELQKLLSQLEETLKNFSPPQSLNGLANFKRKLNWPLKGNLLHRFGTSKLDSSLKWNGIMINSKEGNEVQAIQQGRVVFADWLRGFGLMTIIDHGKGYLSLYGHNQSLLKNPGDFVEAGEPISTVGQSGGFPQSALYFEIRHNGKPQNPLQWIKQ
ncbi:peptidoglycan DD-metalloendopeptidase family protein [Kangiella sp. HZ709]|nr:peptidoglycan DD-metalloendopeptidase family protein [Kangiella sp. HZ709]MRX28230.1 peptidoglycan DD-metalloendopeptidase family protein [Kangiella sp. HZ709]